MRVAILGGAGAMGSVVGGRLARAGADVTLVDVWREGVEAIQHQGLRVRDKSGDEWTVHPSATTAPSDVGPVDLALVFVKCYHTEAALHQALPLLGDETAVLTLQNGWGNAPRIAALVGEARVMVGVTYHSATLLGPGQATHTGTGMTYLGELDGRMSDRLAQVVRLFQAAGLDVTPTDQVRQHIWQKLALNVCTLPTSALLRFQAHMLIEHSGTLATMRELLRETVAVAEAQGIDLDYDERWEAMTGLLKRAVGAKGSMLQDVERGRRTEIDVINGAVVEAGQQLAIPTPYNDTMLWLVKALEETFPPPSAA